MKNKTLLLLSLLLHLGVAHAQDENAYTDVHYYEKNETLFNTPVTLDTKDNIHSFITKLLDYGKLQSKIKESQLNRLKNLDKNWVIIVVHNNLTWANQAFKKDLKKLNVVILHRERKQWSIKRDWSEYALNTKQILLVLLGDAGVREDGSLVDLDIEIKNNDSFFKNSVQELVKVIKDSGLHSESKTEGNFGLKDGLPVRLITLKRNKIRPPSTITYNPVYVKEITATDTLHPIRVTVDDLDLTESTAKKTMEDNFKKATGKGKVAFNIPNISVNYKPASKKMTIDVHERNFFAFSVGISGAQFNVRDFTLDSVRNVAISKLDSTHQKEWKSNLNVNLEFYPFGRDIDQLEPLLKRPFYRLHTRIGVFGGVRLSQDPLSALNAGLTFCLQ